MKNDKLGRLVKWQEPLGSNDSEALVLFLHGMDSSPHKIADVIGIIEDELEPARILVPEMALRWNRHFDFRELAGHLLDTLDQEMREHPAGGCKRLYLIGHSAGGVLVQILYLLLHESERTGGLAALETGQVQLILLAPLNRGWQITHHLPITHKISWALGFLLMMPSHAIAEAAERRDWDSWLMQLRRGSSLITWLRLKWLQLGDKQPSVVQLLGSKDEIISWRDMVDAATAERTVFFDVPYSDHASVVDFADARHGAARAMIFRKALQPDLSPPEENDYRVHSLENDEVKPIIPWDEDPAKPDRAVSRVVFVIHGIRDEGHWTQKIANRARAIFTQEGQGSREQIAVETSSYGYFSMLQFLLPWEREKKVLWLMDRYIEARRRYPEAKFSYIGHSHGTFLVAKALKSYEEVAFERIAFAGSVVNRNYSWSGLLDQGRVERVLNFSASKDWVVGIFPKIAQIYPIGILLGRELGSAGSDPFRQSASDKRVVNNEYIKGAHGAAIQEDNWDNLAKFAVCNEIPAEDTPYYQKRPVFLFNGLMGWLTCVGGWFASAFIGLYWLPKAAWNAPDWFWGVGLGGMLGAMILVAAIHPLTRGKYPELRKFAQKLSLLIFLVSLAGMIIFWLWLPCWSPPSLLEDWTVMETVRAQTLSVVAYLFALWTILTKV